MHGTLTKEQVNLIVSMCEITGKIQGVSAYVALGDLLAALENFDEVDATNETEELETS